MKKRAFPLFLFVVILALAALAQSQEIFEALRSGDGMTPLHLAATSSSSISETGNPSILVISKREARPLRKDKLSSLFAQSSQQMKDGSANASSIKVVVPEGKANQIVIDGIFSKGEWDDSLKLSISENYDIYLKVCSGNLFVGLKSARPVGMVLSEIYITSNEKEFYNLHSSMALGEGTIPFPADRKTIKFSVNNNNNWEANCCKYNNVEYEKWVADGKPSDIEKYDRIFEKKDGKEYRINLIKFSGTRLRMSVGLREAKEAVSFPDNLSFKNCDGWLELILPFKKNK